MGIQIYDDCGHVVEISNADQQIWANPADINVLPEYQDDPRTVDNLLDGVNHTSDDLHAWLTPYTSGLDHLIFINFDRITTISMIKIWNYNKNRIHSYRGARYLEISIDGKYIFKGEVKRALGSVLIDNFDECSESIYFTKSPLILGLIEKNDPITQSYLKSKKDYENEQQIKSNKFSDHLAAERLYFDYDNDDNNEDENECVYSNSSKSISPRPTTTTGVRKSFGGLIEGDSRRSPRGDGLSNLMSSDGRREYSRAIIKDDVSLLRPSTAAIARHQKPVYGKQKIYI
jgi:hypothetical protein